MAKNTKGSTARKTSAARGRSTKRSAAKRSSKAGLAVTSKILVMRVGRSTAKNRKEEAATETEEARLANQHMLRAWTAIYDSNNKG